MEGSVISESLVRSPSPASHQDSPLLRVKGLSVEIATARGKITPVANVDLELYQGQTLGLVGESGSGKSLTALSLMGLVPKPAGQVVAGEIHFQGADLVSYDERQYRRIRGSEIAMVFQDPLSSLNPVYSVGYQIAEMYFRHGRRNRREAKEGAIDLMRRVGIPDAHNRAGDYPHQFSGGMRQRVVIAMALALGPSVLLADEPTTALDVTVQAQIMELFREIQVRDRTATLFISHDLGLVAQIAQNVAVMYAGHVVESGPIRDVYDQPAHPYTKSLMQSAPAIEREQESLRAIEGTPPDLNSLPGGCSFHPRCPIAQERCRTEEPPLRRVGKRRHSACHFAEEVLDDV